MVPGGEDDYDAAVDMISETDWSQPTKKLREGTQEKLYAYFGQTVKAQTAAIKKEPTPVEGDSKMITT